MVAACGGAHEALEPALVAVEGPLFDGQLVLEFQHEGAVAFCHVEECVAFVSVHALSVQGGPVAVDGQLGIPEEEEGMERGGLVVIEGFFDGERDSFEEEGDTGDGVPSELDGAEVDEPFRFLGAEDAKEVVEVG